MNPPAQSWWQRPQPAWVMFALNILFMTAVLLLWNAPWASASSATTDNTTAVQGYLTDTAGNPLNGTVNLSFAIYDTAVSGTLLWGPETYTDYPITQGQYAVNLGSLTVGGIPTAVWQNDQLFLETTVNGETMTPREPMQRTAVANFAQEVAYPQLTRYTLSRSATNVIYWTHPTGEQSSLNVESCTVGSWCCDGGRNICLLRQNGPDAIVELALENDVDIACIMAHREDDVPSSSKGFYFATDAGNSTHSGRPAVRLSREGAPNNPILSWKAYEFVCGW